MTRVAVLGAGAWGTSIASVLAARLEVTLWARDPAQAQLIARTRRNERYLRGIEIPAAVRITANLADVERADLFLAATPVAGLRELLQKIEKDPPVVWLCKGFEEGTGLLPHQIAEQTLLEQRLEAGEWVVSVELDPPKGTNMESMLRVAERLRVSGAVHEADINDNPMARARLSALMAAVAIERTVGLETIPHVTPRDASVMGLQSQLLGAHAAGIRNVLAVTGDPPHVGDYPGSSGVYEVDAIGLTAMLSHLNAGEDFSGKAIDAPTSFYVGVAVNPSADDMTTEIERFRRKLDAGARFGMTQALFDIGYLDRMLDELGGSPIPLLVGVWPLTSAQLAFRLHNEVPGITIPDEVQRRLADAGADARRLGFELARELVDAARSRAAGVYVIPPFKEPEAALELLAT